MVRTQIQLTEEQAEVVKRVAAEEGISVAELVRRSLERYVMNGRGLTAEEVRLRALSISGIARGGPADIARRHDDYLAEAYE